VLKVVLDTNVLVSAVISPTGPPARVLELAADGAFQLIVSPPIIAEYEGVLARRRFGLSVGTVHAIVASIRKLSIEIVPSEPLAYCRDPGDDKFLACACATGAEFLVTGNARHFPRLFQGVRIVPPAIFLREIERP